MLKNKKFYTIIGISVSVFVVSMLLSYLAFTLILTNPMKEKNLETASKTDAKSIYSDNVETAAAEEDGAETNGAEEYYVVKENGNKIGVYAYKNGEPVFLYNIDVNVNSLPDKDKDSIRQGLVLYSKEELAHFEEDFGS